MECSFLIQEPVLILNSTIVLQLVQNLSKHFVALVLLRVQRVVVTSTSIVNASEMEHV
jgi:hypothetical protein